MLAYRIIRPFLCVCNSSVYMQYPLKIWTNHVWRTIVGTIPSSFHLSLLITEYVTRDKRWVSLFEQELPILPVHLSSPLIFCRICVAQSLVSCILFVDHCLPFCLFILLTIVLSVYPFDIFKPFFGCNINSVFITVLKLFILYYM